MKALGEFGSRVLSTKRVLGLDGSLVLFGWPPWKISRLGQSGSKVRSITLGSKGLGLRFRKAPTIRAIKYRIVLNILHLLTTHDINWGELEAEGRKPFHCSQSSPIVPPFGGWLWHLGGLGQVAVAVIGPVPLATLDEGNSVAQDAMKILMKILEPVHERE